MELVNLKVSFIRRIIQPILLSFSVLIFWNILLLYLLKNSTLILFALVSIPVSFISIYEIIKSYYEGEYFLEYLSINPELEICHIRCVKKDQVFKELKVPFNQVKATLKSIPGNPSTTYKLIIQIDNLLFIEQFELVHFNRRKMIEIINCFNPASPSVF